MIKLQILGVNGHKSTNVLISNTIAAIKALGLIVKLEEVNDIDQFIKYDLLGIPALTINGQLACQQTVPKIEDLVGMLSPLSAPVKLQA